MTTVIYLLGGIYILSYLFGGSSTSVIQLTGCEYIFKPVQLYVFCVCYGCRAALLSSSKSHDILCLETYETINISS